MTNGIVITEAGQDVANSPDYRQVLNSQWPVLEIAYEDTVEDSIVIPAGAAYGTYVVKLASVSLGYAPAFYWMDVGSMSPFLRNTSPAGQTYNIMSGVDGVYLEYNYSSSGAGETFTLLGKLFVFAYNPKKEFKAPIVSGQKDLPQAESQYGAAILKNASEGGMNSTDFRHFSLNTKAKAWTIHQSGIASAWDQTDYNLVIEHDLGYFPSYMTWRTATAPDWEGPGTPIAWVEDGYLREGGTVRSFGTPSTLSFAGVQATLVEQRAYVIFKDPLLQEK